MPDCRLDDRVLLRLTGEEATHFLHNLITTNVETLEPGVVRAGALLTPQGKVLFDFLVSKDPDGNGFWLDVDAAQKDAFAKRLTLYKLRAKVVISESDQSVMVSFAEADSLGSDADSTMLEDTRFPDGIMARRYGAPLDETADRSGYDALRVAHGVVESGADYALSDAFAHDVSLDQNGGVDFRKGCYVGQEVVSRMHHRKTARRRVVIVSGPALETGATLMADGKPAGTIGTVSGEEALAIARLDRLKDAMDAGASITVSETAVSVRLPDGVSYDWPQPAKDEAPGA